MLRDKLQTFRKPASLGVAAAAALLAWAPPMEARVTRVVITTVTSPAFGGAEFPAGSGRQYETIVGRAFGELDPNHPRHAIITDLQLAPKNANGNVEYVATFQLTKPIDMTKSSGLMWHGHPNRGGRLALGVGRRNQGDVGLSSDWQADNAGGTAWTSTTNDHVQVPVAVNPDGSMIVGTNWSEIVNASGPASQPVNMDGNPVPYLPATLDTTQHILRTHTSQTADGVVTYGPTIPSSDWAFARCTDWNNQTPQDLDPANLPGSLPFHICLKNGFDPTLYYELIYQAKNPYVVGMGHAAFSDVAAFFRFAAQDDVGTPNPVAGGVQWIITYGSSQAGASVKQLLNNGFTVDEAGRKIYDGAWPTITGRRVSQNSRWASGDSLLWLYRLGGEGHQWYVPWPDPVRGLPTRSVLDRCTATNSCPKIIETYGGIEVYFGKIGPQWAGTAADKDIPIPRNYRRYYISSSTHGGGGGGFNEAPAPAAPNSNCTLRGNPMPFTQTTAALEFHLRNWVVNGTSPPPSRWPTLAGKTLVENTAAAMGMPSGIPEIPPGYPTGHANPSFDYDHGPQFDHSDGAGVPTIVPGIVKQVLKTMVPKMDKDGNELGGVPVVLREAPLGSYFGWNITRAGFYEGKQCGLTAGMVPFAKTKAERLATGDPRLSLEERYGTHAGYVAAVTAAANNVFKQGFLLAADRDALIAQAAASNVCNQPGDGGKCNPAAP